MAEKWLGRGSGRGGKVWNIEVECGTWRKELILSGSLNSTVLGRGNLALIWNILITNLVTIIITIIDVLK